MVVLAVEERQRDDLVHRDDLGVAERGGKELPELFESRFGPFSGRTSFIHQNRGGERGAAVVVGPLAAGYRRLDLRRPQAASCWRFAGDDLQLHAPVSAGVFV